MEATKTNDYDDVKIYNSNGKEMGEKEDQKFITSRNRIFGGKKAPG